MAYHYENLKLEKGMYSQSGRSFAQTLEALDPSENYKGTSLEGLDAFQRQLKRFDIKVKGAGSDAVEKFFATSQSAVLFPEYIARSVRQGMEEANLLPHITAAVTRFDGMDYRSIASVPDDDQRALRWVEEGAAIPRDPGENPGESGEAPQAGADAGGLLRGGALAEAGPVLGHPAPDRRAHQPDAPGGRHRCGAPGGRE